MISGLGIEAIQWRVSNGSYIASIDEVFLGLVSSNEFGWYVSMKPRGGGVMIFRGLSLPGALLKLELEYKKGLSWFQWNYLNALVNKYSVS